MPVDPAQCRLISGDLGTSDLGYCFDLGDLRSHFGSSRRTDKRSPGSKMPQGRISVPTYPYVIPAKWAADMDTAGTLEDKTIKEMLNLMPQRHYRQQNITENEFAHRLAAIKKERDVPESSPEAPVGTEIERMAAASASSLPKTGDARTSRTLLGI